MEETNVTTPDFEASLIALSRSILGNGTIKIEALAGAGSSRKYYRLTSSDGSVIGVVGSDTAENRAFIELSRHFTGKGLPMARILAAAPDGKCYIVNDLGNTSLFDRIGETSLVAKTIACLPTIQIVGNEGLDYSHCYPVAEMDHRSVMWDLNYFKYCFLKPTGLEFDEAALEDDFEHLAGDLLDRNVAPEWGFMYRDFQSRNVMIVDDEPRFIDFQGGRRGPCQYDLVSFLWQARANFSHELRQEMIERYLDAYQLIKPIDREAFKTSLRRFILFRLMQVLGAYGFRGLIQNKTHFIVSILPALQSLAYELGRGVADEYPALRDILTALTTLEAFQPETADGLTVKVNSFGFRKSGIPRDLTGNGGGFVFDCRSLPNPGRLEEFKRMTGRDQAVKDYLEQYPEVDAFFDNASALVERAVKRYMERGFTNLSVNFGCTGGQHRSVYMAERMADILRGRTGLRVVLTHVEQNIKEIHR